MRFATLGSLLAGHAGPYFINPTASATDAVCRLQERELGALVLGDKTPPVKIVTDRHIVECVVARRRDADAMTALEVSTPIESFAPTTTLDAAWNRVRQKKLAWIAVRDGDRVVALVSRTQMLEWLVHAQEAEVDCAIGAVQRLAFSNHRPY